VRREKREPQEIGEMTALQEEMVSLEPLEPLEPLELLGHLDLEVCVQIVNVLLIRKQLLSLGQN
jgi:hypothetical protein